MINQIRLLLFLLIFWGLQGCSRGGSDDPVREDTQKTGSVSGTTTDSNGGVLSNVTVTIGDNDVLSGQNGAYNLNNVPVGSASITANKAGYITYFADVSVTENMTTDHNIALVTAPPLPTPTQGTTISFTAGTSWNVYKDGPNGPWLPIPTFPPAFDVMDPLGRFAVAEYRTESGIKQVNIWYLTVDSLGLLKRFSTYKSGGNKTINATVYSAIPGSQGFVTAPNRNNSVNIWNDPDNLNVTLTNIKTGFTATVGGILFTNLNDLLANLISIDNDGNYMSSHYYLDRDLVTDANLTDQFIQFTTTPGFEAAPVNHLTIDGLSGTETQVDMVATFTSRRKAVLDIAKYTITDPANLNGSALNFSWRGIPAIRQLPSDESLLFNVNTLETNNADTLTKEVRYYDMSLVDTTLTLPNVFNSNSIDWTLPLVDGKILPNIEVALHNDATFSLPSFHVVTLNQSASSIQWKINMNKAWVENNALSYQTPDFSAISDWDSTYSLAQGSEISLEYQSWHSDASNADLYDNTYPTGSTVKIVGIKQVKTP